MPPLSEKGASLVLRNKEYWENRNRVMYKPVEGYDFSTPAEQSVARGLGSPLWEPTFASRASLPAYKRQEVFGCLSYQDMRTVRFVTPQVEYPSGIVQPSGLVSMHPIHRSSPVSIPDREMYDCDTQKLFSVFTQFDALFTQQVAAFTGLSEDRVIECANTLHAYGVLERAEPGWVLEDQFGILWRLNRRSVRPRAYANGMDSIPRVLMEGNRNSSKQPPGGGARSGLKHNLYAAEMCLRLAESADNVVGVWGDSFLDSLSFHVPDTNADAFRNSHADCAVVTRDGSVVLFEVVGRNMRDIAVDQSIVEKAASWVGVIANSPIDLSVIFIDVTFAHSFRTTIRSVDIGIRKDSAQYAPNPYMRSVAAKHVGVTGGNFWFPEDHAISQGGTRLTAYNTMTRKFHSYDIPDSTFSAPEIRRNIIVNSVSALHTPPWIMNPLQERNYVTD